MPKMFVVEREGAKCGGCNWGVDLLYAYADSQEQATELYVAGEAGLCGSCMSDLLVETGYEIVVGSDGRKVSQ